MGLAKVRNCSESIWDKLRSETVLSSKYMRLAKVRNCYSIWDSLG